MQLFTFKQSITEWLMENELFICDLLSEEIKELKNSLNAEPEFFEEIIQEFKDLSKVMIAEEISRQLGIQVDIIFEVLEQPEIQDYIYDSICSNG